MVFYCSVMTFSVWVCDWSSGFVPLPAVSVFVRNSSWQISSRQSVQQLASATWKNATRCFSNSYNVLLWQISHLSLNNYTSLCIRNEGIKLSYRRNTFLNMYSNTIKYHNQMYTFKLQWLGKQGILLTDDIIYKHFSINCCINNILDMIEIIAF